MSALRDIAQFRSANLAPVLPEECQVNPNVYGFELAYWLCAELFKQGVATSYPNQEDWGWYIEFLPPSGSEFAIHCSNVDGKKDEWVLSLQLADTTRSRTHTLPTLARTRTTDRPSGKRTARLVVATG